MFLIERKHRIPSRQVNFLALGKPAYLRVTSISHAVAIPKMEILSVLFELQCTTKMACV